MLMQTSTVYFLFLFSLHAGFGFKAAHFTSFGFCLGAKMKPFYADDEQPIIMFIIVTRPVVQLSKHPDPDPAVRLQEGNC